MGNQVRTPRTIYKDGYVMEFNVRNKEVHYKISKWNKSAFHQASLCSGKLNGLDPKMILQSFITETTQQHLSSVEVSKK